MVNILWVSLFIDDTYTLGPVFDTVERAGYKTHVNTWHKPGPVYQLATLIHECLTHQAKFVILQYPEMHRISIEGAVFAFHEAGAKVILVQNGRFEETSYGEDGRINLLFKPSTLIQLLETLND